MSGLPEESISVLEWNVYKGNRAGRVRRRLRKWLKKGKYDVVVLNEALRFHDVIEAVAKDLGYIVCAEVPATDRFADPRPEKGNTVVLVRKQDDLVLLDWRVAVMDEPWTVWSHKQRHVPRRQIVILLRGRGGLWLIAGQHWATAGNREAQEESKDWTLGLLTQTNDTRDERVVASSIGDHNVRVPDLKEMFPKHKVVGHVVDSVVTEARRVIHTRLGKGGSDHAANEFVLVR